MGQTAIVRLMGGVKKNVPPTRPGVCMHRLETICFKCVFGRALRCARRQTWHRGESYFCIRRYIVPIDTAIFALRVCVCMSVFLWLCLFLWMPSCANAHVVWSFSSLFACLIFVSDSGALTLIACCDILVFVRVFPVVLACLRPLVHSSGSFTSAPQRVPRWGGVSLFLPDLWHSL